MKYSKDKTMNQQSYFDISRFWLLLKMELFRSKSAVGMTIVITFGVLFFIDLMLSTLVEQNKVIHDHTESYAFTLMIGGFILSSLAFNDLSNTLRSYNYLTLPSSTLEKVISMWLLTSFGWIIMFTITFTFYTMIANPIGHLIFNRVSFQAFNPVGEFAMTTMKAYFVLQGIFLVGATRFKGYALPKTLFVLLLFAMFCITIIYFTLGDLFLGDHECFYDENGVVQCELIDAMAIHRIWHIIQWLFWWVLAPVCWVIAYLGLKEKEV